MYMPDWRPTDARVCMHIGIFTQQRGNVDQSATYAAQIHQ